MNTQDEQEFRGYDSYHGRPMPNDWINWKILDANTKHKVMLNISNCRMDSHYFRQMVPADYRRMESQMSFAYNFAISFVTTPADRTGR